MSIYVMTVGDLAKKRGEPVGEFLKKVQSVGFDAGSHAKKLTQEDLHTLIPLLDGNGGTGGGLVAEKEVKTAINPNVLMIKNGTQTIVAVVDATLKEDGGIGIEVIESSVENSLGETLLQFRKQLGLKLGIN